MKPLIVEPVIRVDAAGDGHYGAPRSKREDGQLVEYTHRGIDYLCTPGGFVCSPVAGVVSKLGHCYINDPAWRYVEVTDDLRFRHRLFYAIPLVGLNEAVTPGQIVGEAQDIASRYPDQKMLAHVHYEVIGPDGQYVHPENRGLFNT